MTMRCHGLPCRAMLGRMAFLYESGLDGWIRLVGCSRLKELRDDSVSGSCCGVVSSGRGRREESCVVSDESIALSGAIF